MKGTADEVDVTTKPSFVENKNGLTITQQSLYWEAILQLS